MSKTKDRVIAVAESAHMAVRKEPRILISLEAVARQAGYLMSRLHAVFSRRYGEPFSAFVHRVQLEKACGLMRAHRNWRLTKIALEADCSESPDFSHSFRRAFRVAPRKWDRIASLNGLRQNKKNRQVATSAACDNAVMKAAPDLSMKDGFVRIEDRPAQMVAIYPVAQAAQGQKLRDGWDCFEDRFNRSGQLHNDHMVMGLSYDSHYDSHYDRPGKVYRFELAHAVNEGVKAQNSVVIRDLPATQAAILSCQGGLADFSGAWYHFDRIFLPETPCL